NGASRSTFPARASFRTSAATKVLVMLPMANIASGATGRPCPSTPAAPLHVPASLTIVALRPGAPTREFGERPFSWTTASSPACTAAATAGSRGAADGAGNGSLVAPTDGATDDVTDGVTDCVTDGVTDGVAEPAALGPPLL